MILKNVIRREKKVIVVIAAIVLCIVIVVCIILPPSTGKTEPYLDDDENVIAGSISEKISVDINGTSLGMFIMAKDNTKPVLLFLGGGPGIPEYFLEQSYPSKLEDEFVVCYLDYRGTALSYDPELTTETMTTEQYVSDAAQVTKYLSERFGQEKIYLMGHSFGTYIGLKVVHQYPNMYHAYIAMSQITNSPKSEKLAYSYMREQYEIAGNTKMVQKFDDYPILTSEKAYERYTASSLRDTAMHELGVGTMRNMKSVISGIFFPSLRCTAYTQAERINIWKGKDFSQSTPIFEESRQYDSFNEVSSIEVPIYFFAGIHDYTVCYSLQQEYYEKINAPIKAFYTFHNSAHSPLFEESEKALAILAQNVLTRKTTLSDQPR
ncbi:alpha/beta fold hydrolase [Enterococcus sp. AZ163]|uniref:alpha/beta fold hydrolase n=1 Tax=Enterococcus sp. AZ163 TaxID=2774638 RepID=UPI003D286C68